MNWSHDAPLLLYFCVFVLICGLRADRILVQLLPQHKPHRTAAASVLAAAVLFCVHGPCIISFQYWLICQILLYASAHDLATHVVPDHVHLLVLIAGLAHIPDLIHSVAGLLVLPLPFLLVALIAPGKVGGADIKLMAALGFTLGVRAGTGAAIVGLLLAVLIQSVYKPKAGFALVPYLSLGAFLAFLT